MNVDAIERSDVDVTAAKAGMAKSLLQVESPLIKLVPLEHIHGARILTLMDDDVCRHLGRKPATDLAQVMSYIYDLGSTQPIKFAVCHQAFGLIGVISFGCLDKLPLEAVIGYWIGRYYQGMGYAKQSIRMVLPLLKKFRISRVLAEVYPDNSRSEYVLESVGFKCENKTQLENDQRQYYLTL